MNIKQLDFLIKQLSPAIKIPRTEQEKWTLYRTLVNTRMPEPVSDDFLAAESELLCSMTAEKGITAISDLQPLKDNLYLWQGDITTLKVGAIVNAANSRMLGCFVPCHSCIDNAIHTFAGVQLRLACNELMNEQGRPEETGKAKITSAFNLPSDYILHTVGPIITGSLTERDCELLASCYRSCLMLAAQTGITSIAFCCISTGEFHFPNGKAAEIAVQTVSDFITESKSSLEVVFNVFKETDYEIYRQLLTANR